MNQAIFDVAVVECGVEGLCIGLAIREIKLAVSGIRGCCIGRIKLDTKNSRSCECQMCIHFLDLSIDGPSLYAKWEAN